MHGLVVSDEAKNSGHLKLNYEKVIDTRFVRFPVTYVVFLQQYAFWKL